MKYFRMDNTEGYTQEHLDWMNNRVDKIASNIDTEKVQGIFLQDIMQSITESVQKEFDERKEELFPALLEKNTDKRFQWETDERDLKTGFNAESIKAVLPLGYTVRVKRRAMTKRY